MAIEGFPDMFQAKMMELMESLEYVQAFIDDLLCISIGSLEDHLDKTRGGSQATLRCWLKSQC